MALSVLEEAADLVSRTRALPPDTPISFCTPGLEGFDTTRATLGGLRYDPVHMREQFAHPAFDPLRNHPVLRERFKACRDVFVEVGIQNCIPPQ